MPIISLAACADPATGDVANAEHHKPCDPKNAIVFAAALDGQANTDLYLVAPHHRTPTRLTHSDGPILYPAWSPDHTRVAFVRNLQLFVLDVASGDEQLVADKVGRTNDPYAPEVSGPAWSPDGTQLAYPYPRDPQITDDGDGPFDDSFRTTLHFVNADGTNDVAYQEPQQDGIPSGVGTLGQPAWSSTNRLAFSVVQDCPNCDGGSFWYSTSNVDGTRYHELQIGYSPTSPPPRHDADWSPDATRWVYTAVDPDSLKIESPGTIATRSMLDLTSDAQILTTNAWYPRYSADGSSIAFLRTDGVYVMNADGSDPVRLARATGVRGLDW